jgi:acetyl-CoA carboxylase biotin carboxyl carrier protein
MAFTIDEVLEVLALVRECKDTELYIDTGEMKLSLVKGKVSASGRNLFETAAAPAAADGAKPPEAKAAATPAARPQAAPAAAPPPAAAEPEPMPEEGLVPIKANVTSVFYRRPSPEEAPFVEVGDPVQEDTVVCLLEVMKCFRQVMAETKGRIARICVESNSLVEEGTVLFLIQPE